MPDIGDFIRRSRRSAKIAIAALGTPGDFRRSRRSAYKIARCVAGLRSRTATLIIPVWSNGHCRTDLVDQFLNWSDENRMICNPSKCKEIIFRKKGFIQDIFQVNNIPQWTELPILGFTFQENCKYSKHVRAKLIKANKCLFVLRSLR